MNLELENGIITDWKSDSMSNDDEEEEFQYPTRETEEEFIYNGIDSIEVENYQERLNAILDSPNSSPIKPKALSEPSDVDGTETPPLPLFDTQISTKLARINRRISATNSIADSTTSSTTPFPRRPVTHPNISRLRSSSTQFQRFPSTSSQSTLFELRNNEFAEDSAGTGGMSRDSSISNIHDFTRSEINTSYAGSDSIIQEIGGSDTLKWSSLKRISTKIYSKAGMVNGLGASMGNPTVLSVSGSIAIGTDKGWVGIYDFNQNLISVCGTESIAKDAGSVTALAISQDQTFLAVGHATGSIHIYSLAKPSIPARSVLPTTLASVLTGRKEGHLVNTKILHIGFVGIRHTAIISSDENALAFYHSLGRVLGLASNDIIRMLGKYPEPVELDGEKSTYPIDTKLVRTRKSTILSMAGLPLGPAIHSSDDFNLVAILTGTKLVVVGLKPSARTWWRAINSDEEAQNGTVAWFPSFTIESESKESLGHDPLLAFTWEKQVRLLRLEKEVSKDGKGGIHFVELKGLECDSKVLGLQWYSHQHLCIMTSSHMDVYDITNQTLIGRDSLDIKEVIPISYASAPAIPDSLSYSSSFKLYKRKLFLLTTTDVRAGTILSWADKILSLMKGSTILSAIELTTRYLIGHSDASTITLPTNMEERREVVEPKLEEILKASLEFVFSEERLKDGSHSSSALIQNLFQELVGTCVRACLALDDVDWLFSDLYEKYELNGIEGIFLEEIERFVIEGEIINLPPSVSQRLIGIFAERGEFRKVERIIWNVDPEGLDVDQVLGICLKHQLYDGLIYVFSQCLKDWISPFVELFGIVKKIMMEREEDENTVGDGPEAELTDAYRIFNYLSISLAGLSYPSKASLSYADSNYAKNLLYDFIFSGSTRIWPERGGKVILTTQEDGMEPTYPYLRLLLKFDSEAMLDALDLGFEESYFEDEIVGRNLNRQNIIDLLIEIMEDDSTIDQTFSYIFIARNLPKYTQFLKLTSQNLQKILLGLVDDSDASTTEDRQLATEFLLSVYTPEDPITLIELFEGAKFYRILRSIYKVDKKWAALASTYIHDSSSEEDVFPFLKQILKWSSRSTIESQTELRLVLLNSVDALVEGDENGLREIAELFDEFLGEFHEEILTKLDEWSGFNYLRYLLEPQLIGDGIDRIVSKSFNLQQKLHYVNLLCENDSTQVIRFLQSQPNLIESQHLIKILEERDCWDAVIWVLSKSQKKEKALNLVGESLESRVDLIIQSILTEEVEEEENIINLVGQIQRISKIGIELCSNFEESSSAESKSREDLWYELLSSIISTIQSLRPHATPISNRRSSISSIIIHSTFPSSATTIISNLLPTALSALVSSTTSNTLSFPSLINRLLSSHPKSSSHEFKEIVNSILETYKFELDLLTLTSAITSADLFSLVENLSTVSKQGWRPNQSICPGCNRSVFINGSGSGGEMSRSDSASKVVTSLGLDGKPRLTKRASLKGKEVEYATVERIRVEERLKGILIEKSGMVWHERCRLRAVSLT